MKYLIDTNICIFIINQRPAEVRQRLEKLEIGDVGVSAVTVSELQYGVAKSRDRERNQAALDKFLLPLEVLPYEDSAARRYGYLRRHLEKQGTPIGPLDLMIAAHALAINTIVVTNNTAEFERVPDLPVEDWTVPS